MLYLTSEVPLQEVGLDLVPLTRRVVDMPLDVHRCLISGLRLAFGVLGVGFGVWGLGFGGLGLRA